MTKEEIMKNYGVSNSALTNQFKRTQDSILKKYGVYIIKKGRGANAVYEISNQDTLKMEGVAARIEFIKDAHKEVLMSQQAFTDLIDWDFMVFLGIVTCPMLIFRGTAHQFLDYVGIKHKTADNVKRLHETFNRMKEQGYIMYEEDHTTDEDYFWVAVYRSTELDMKIGIDMIQTCMRLQKENNMNSWVPLLKTWVGLQLLTFDKSRQDVTKGEDVIITLEELSQVTGVNNKMLTKCKKILESNALFQSSRAYNGRFKCIGQKITLDGTKHNYKNMLVE